MPTSMVPIGLLFLSSHVAALACVAPCGAASRPARVRLRAASMRMDEPGAVAPRSLADGSLLTDGQGMVVRTDEEASSLTNYRRGRVTIGAITVMFASNSPVVHSAFTLTEHAPPVLLLNSAVALIALMMALAFCM